MFPSEKWPDNSVYIKFVNLLRMIKKTSWTNKQRTPGLDSGTHETSVSVWTRLSFEKRGCITTRQHPAGDTMIDCFQNPWYLASIAWILFALVVTHGIKVFQKTLVWMKKIYLYRCMQAHLHVSYSNSSMSA